MQPTPQRSMSVRVPPELVESLGQMEGRIPANELALRVVRAATMLPGVTGARLWRIEQDEANVWAEIGTLPAESRRPDGFSSREKTAVPSTVWTGALGRACSVYISRSLEVGV